MSTRKEIEERKKAKKAKIKLESKYNIRTVNVYANNEPFVENIGLSGNRLNELICSGLYNVKYSSVDDVTNLHLIRKQNLGEI